MRPVYAGRAGHSATQSGQRIGPYLLGAEIGAGAMGVVYDAVHAEHGEHVALKTVRLPQADLLSSIRREIHALHRLQHPGVVRIVDEGVTDGQSWYAMVLLRGPTLRGYLEGRSQAHPPGAVNGDLPRVLDLMRRLCDALGFLHGEGIVHGDIKPENVFLEPDDQPVLVDFGLAWQVPGVRGREVLHDRVGTSGTPAYMAPEQIAGEAVDPRADFYSLGCVLYELLTGRPPFLAKDVARLFTQHLSSSPPPPSSIAPSVPTALDALVAALMHKQRRERLGYADDVIAELDEAVAKRPPMTPAAQPMRYLYRPGLAGRDALLTQLLAAVERARNGAGACVLIGGESGIGKTYLSTELARRCSSDIRVAVNNCVPVGGVARGGLAAPLQSLRGLLQSVADRCAEGGEEITDRLLGARGRTLAAYEPTLAGLPGQAKFPVPPQLQGAAGRDHLLDCCAETLAAFAEDRPLLLLVDDLQWADELTLRFLQTLPAEWFHDKPLLVLGTYRTDEAPPEIDEIKRRDDIHHIELGGVDASSATALMLDMLALKDLPPTFAQLLVRQAQGNPFYIAEYLRMGIAEGVLRRTRSRTLQIGGLERPPSAGELEALPLPRSLRELVLRRIAGLSPEARALVDVAAVFGRELDGDLLRVASGLSELKAMEATAELLRRETIEHLGGGKLRFVHDKLSEIAYDNLPADRRRVLHARVAASLEQRDGGVRPTDYAGLAHHWGMAANGEKELHYRDAAGSGALTAAAFAEAVQHFERALALADAGTALPSGAVTPSLRVKWEFGIAQAEHARGDVPAAEAHAIRALERVGYRWPRSTTRWLTLLLAQIPPQLAHRWALPWGSPPGSEERDALRSAARAAELLTHRYFYVENTPAMLASAFLSANLADRAAAQSDVPKAYIAIAFLAGVLRLRRLANSYFEIARGGVELIADPVQRADGLASQSVYHATFGAWKLAEDAVLAALACVRDGHDPFMQETVLTTIGHVEYFTGRFQAAFERYKEVLESARARGNVQHVPWGLFSMARSLVALGRFDEAIPLLEEAGAALAERPELQSEITCSGLLALARLKVGDVGRARTQADATALLIRRAQPTGFPTVEGYNATLDVYLELLASLPSQTAASLEDNTRTVLRALRQFVRLIPMAQPMALLRAGRYAAHRGRLRRARRLLAQALKSAERLAMPREQAQAHVAIAHMSKPRSPERAAHLEAARRGFTAMGCEPEALTLET